MSESIMLGELMLPQGEIVGQASADVSIEHGFSGRYGFSRGKNSRQKKKDDQKICFFHGALL